MVVGKRKPPKGARAGVHRRRESPEGGGAQACAPPTRKGEVVTCRAVSTALTGLTASRLYQRRCAALTHGLSHRSLPAHPRRDCYQL